MKLNLVQHLAAAGSELSGGQAAQDAISKLQYPLEINNEISFLTGSWILFSHKFGACLTEHGDILGRNLCSFQYTLHCLPYMWACRLPACGHPCCLLQKVKCRTFLMTFLLSPHIVPALWRSFLDLASPCYAQLGVVLLEVQCSACLPPHHAAEILTPPGAPLSFLLPVQLP